MRKDLLEIVRDAKMQVEEAANNLQMDLALFIQEQIKQDPYMFVVDVGAGESLENLVGQYFCRAAKIQHHLFNLFGELDQLACDFSKDE